MVVDEKKGIFLAEKKGLLLVEDAFRNVPVLPCETVTPAGVYEYAWIPPDDDEHIRQSKKYREYITSPEWYARRDQWILKFSRRCYICGTPYPVHPEGHHFVYERLCQELDEDICIVCRGPCHDQLDLERRTKSFPPPSKDVLLEVIDVVPAVTRNGDSAARVSIAMTVDNHGRKFKRYAFTKTYVREGSAIPFSAAFIRLVIGGEFTLPFYLGGLKRRPFIADIVHTLGPDGVRWVEAVHPKSGACL